MKTDPDQKLHDDKLYMGDNGRVLCGKHSGNSAKYSGYDISGQKVLTITPKVMAEFLADEPDYIPTCESPSCDVKPPQAKSK